MWRAIASNGLTLLIVGAVMLAGAILWGKNQYVEPGPLAQGMCVRVKQGETMRGLSDDLVKTGAVSSGMLFRIGAEYADKSGALKAGAFLVPASASMSDIVDIVTRGGASTCGTEILYRVGVRQSDVLVRSVDPATSQYVEEARYVPGEDKAPDVVAKVEKEPDTRYRIALAEGVTAWQVVQMLNSVDVLDGDIGDLPKEGTLAPDSYEFSKGDTRAALVKRMQDEQTQILDAAWAKKADGIPLKTPQEALIMASIIEKETGVPDERRVVASVFENRLEKGMRLQTDPTVIYGITKGKGVLDRGIRASELRANNAYNTYVVDGLPPTPIANPGKASIEAAVNPEQTNYLYFVADGSGGHAFASTLDEHNRNVAKWRQLESEKQNN
ncbi:endolytic transglycosylase MltG [Pseudooceanicola sp. CBS1P-1]|uniref:Endolytic murein transglycosylase n=1 Tax=Pseudooceanicola albus TaxID=2692189 RepID=A0A6L7GB81_9RHOB|nr:MULTISPECIES: endolytic transglycosylase MltG [Pseudooceanicola]MBT9384245.1 endolytic transglycosylase MltG [Pseudooceanicola endophyticus]MXN20837.1 endolytic transglycosylase MltG [Pseudooceanicola albus]